MPKKVVKWFDPEKERDWHKSQKPSTRRRNLMDSTSKNKTIDNRREEARKAIQALANVTKDEPTRKAAQADANYFSKLRK